MMDKFFRRMGFKDDTGWDDPSVFGFIVLFSIFGYGLFVTVTEIIDRFFA